MLTVAQYVRSEEQIRSRQNTLLSVCLLIQLANYLLIFFFSSENGTQYHYPSSLFLKNKSNLIGNLAIKGLNYHFVISSIVIGQLFVLSVKCVYVYLIGK